ncbi:DUF3509 domain-containing protein [Pseudomonas entomophila]|uniref:DUF3509 domain-containing protein n=1 Tax=Pseudomonas entomophila TaxID=312306 RepID=UPI0015E4602B|nr:DUF3509 domain-containing protein [Pseudomonas entomophila]MBA1194604.1 DUF3509 domain-containing protein [Pseudomonas entomophila]
MHNPFNLISDAFAPRYRVNLSIERLDGSIMLTLSTEHGVAAKRLITPEQRNDPQRLRHVIDSLRLDLASEQGDTLPLLTGMPRDPRSPASSTPVSGVTL